MRQRQNRNHNAKEREGERKRERERDMKKTMHFSPVLSLLRLSIGIAASSFVEVRGVAHAGERPRHHQQHRPQQQQRRRRRQLRFLQPVSDDPTSSTLQPQRQRRHRNDDITLTLLTECVLYHKDIEWGDDPDADESEEEEEEDWFSSWACHFTTNTNNNDNPRIIEVIEEEEEETEMKHSASIGYVAADILAKHPFIDIVGLSRDVIKSFEQQQQKPIVSGGTILKIMTTTVTANNRNRNRNSDRPSPSRRNDDTTNIFDRDVVVATPTATDRTNRPRQKQQQQNQPNSTKQYQKQEQQQEEMIEVEQQPYLEQLITIDTDTTRNPNAIPIEGSLKLVLPPAAVYVLESIPESDPRHYQARHRRRRERQRRDRQLLPEEDKNTEAWYGSFGNTSATPGSSKTRHRTRNLLVSMGNLEALVVRVLAGNRGQPPNEAKLQNDIFSDQACLSSQYRACSHGQLIIEPGRYGTKGITTVRIDGRSINSNLVPGDLADEAITALQNKFGGNFAENIDLLMLCLPPGTYKNGWVRYLLSFYCYYHYYIIHIIVIGNCLCFLPLVFVVSLQIERGKSLSIFGIVFLITFLCTIFFCSFFHFLPSK